MPTKKKKGSATHGTSEAAPAAPKKAGAKKGGESKRATKSRVAPPERDEDEDGRDQRKHARIPLDFIMQVKSDSIDQFKELHAKNISVGGMFIQTAEARPVGSDLFFQFTLKDGGTLIEGLGKVVHSSAQGMGVEFVSVLEPSASIIRALVESRVRSG